MNANGENLSGFDLRSLIKVLKRRIRPTIAVVTTGVILSAVIASILPSVYRSSATVLIEQQEIPQDLVRSTVTSFADQRIQVIIQRAMTFSKLSEIIAKYNLYADMKGKKPLEQIVEDMKSSIEHRMISADVVDPRSGKPVEATIAFSVAFLYEKPDVAQKVANEIVSLFLEENLKNRSELAEQAESFLGEELNKISVKTRQIEEELAEFKKKNLKSLPEQMSINVSMLDRSEKEHDEIRRQIQDVRERKVYLSSQLVNVEPYESVVGDGKEAIMTSEGRIRFLQNKYLSLSAIYSPNHPDVVKTQRELKELASSSNSELDGETIEQQIKILEKELERAKLKYSESHPETRKLARQIDVYKNKLIAAEKTNRSVMATNPAYLQIEASLESLDIELSHLLESKKILLKKIDEIEAALLTAPRVEKEYRDLLRELDNNVAKYQEVKAKQLEAQMARTLEKEQKSERFTLIEPPLVPQKPVKPNRLVVFVAGFFLSILMAGGLVWLLEKLDTSLRSSKDVLAYTGYYPLAIIPHMVTKREVKLKKSRITLASAGMCMILIVALSVVHTLFIPLDVLWFAAIRKIGGV